MTSEVLTVCQQLVLTAFRYPNLSEIINGPKKGKNIPLPPGLEPQATRWPLDFRSSATLGVHPGGMDIFSFTFLYNIKCMRGAPEQLVK